MATTTSLRDDLATSLQVTRQVRDPLHFAALAGYPTLDDWQRRVLTSDAKRIALNCARQVGKSLVTALLSVHTAITQPNATVLILSPTLRQSSLLFRKCLRIYLASGRLVPAHAETALQLRLDNGSEIVSLPGKSEATIRGYDAVALLAIDESARVEEEVYQAITPTLAVSGGRMIALSTPAGRRGWWHAGIRDHAETGWEYYEVPASACSRLSAAFLDEQFRSKGPLLYSQEFECAWVDPQGSLFRSEDVQAALKEYPTWDLSKYIRLPSSRPSASRSTLGSTWPPAVP